MKKVFYTFLLLLFLLPMGYLLYFIDKYGEETKKLQNYQPQLTTQIFDKNGKKIANIFDKEHRYYAYFNEIPPHMVEALLAIEDTAFFEHHGINPDAIFRAIIKDIKAGKLVEGASTITQQLVKNILLTREKKISRKLKELIFSLKLETELTKEQILEYYFNEVYLGHGYYGVKTAADGYFHKELDKLSIKEIAILVGLPKAPSFYAPTKNYELSLGRANRVVERLYTIGWIDAKSYEKAIEERPIVYDDTLTRNRAPFVVDEVIRQLSEEYPDIKTGGYKIYTSIDLKLQKAARESLKYAYDLTKKRYERYGDFNKTAFSELNGAIVSIDPFSGDVLALVGSIDYSKSSFNRATQGRRQPGSAFKPFLYQVALDLGYSPASKLVDIARTYSYDKNGTQMKWQPKNYEKDYKGLMSLRESLVHSRNLATINLVDDIGLSSMINELSRYKIRNLPHNLSLSLGSISLSPLQLAEYYSSFASGGVQVEPILVKKLESARSVYNFQSNRTYITSAEQTYLMTTILRDVVKRGTGRRARVRGIEVAGKTGTTNHSVDAWFAGYSPSVETIVWFGNDNNMPMHKYETGGKVSGPAFRKYYEKLITIYPQVKREFEKPEGVMEIQIGRKTEYFTEISKPAVADTVQEHSSQEELLF